MSNPYTLVARTRRSLMALAAAAVLLVAAALSAHSQTPAPAKIAFDRGGNIWTMDPDGRLQTREDAKPEQTLAAADARPTK